MTRPAWHLRFQVVPGLKETIAPLVDFCVRHQVAEVALFIAAEEWNNALLTPEAEARWCACVAEAKGALEARGISVSLNPWMSVLHTDRGRRMPPALALETMVSPSGQKAKACASFGDPAVVSYISRLYGRFAALGFRLLWIEDDFRFRNHAPLDWGGGFEEGILHRFSQEIGEPVTREALVAALLAPGEPHRWRGPWIQLWGKLHRELMAAIAREVREHGSGKTSLGLMSSSPPFHSLEGRDWAALFGTMEISGKAAHRPNFSAYSEVAPSFYTQPMLMLDLQRRLRPAHVEVAPEIENFPFTRWSKSHRQTWADLVVATLYGADALLLDLFSFCGNSVEADPEIGPLLNASRPTLDWIAERLSKTDPLEGFGVYWHEEAAQRFHLPAPGGSDLAALTPSPFLIGDGLLRYGVPVTFGAGRRGLLLSGAMAWLPGVEELRELLAGPLLLDGVAAAILAKRGFGALIGLKGVALWEREEYPYSLERLLPPSGEARHLLSVNLLPQLAALEPEAGALWWSELLRADGEPTGHPGLYTFENEHGGRVAVGAAGEWHRLSPNPQRQRQMHALIDFLLGETTLKVTGGPYLLPMQSVGAGRRRVAVINGCADEAVPLLHGIAEGVAVTMTLLAPLQPPRALGVARSEGEPLPFPATVPPLGVAFFEF